MAVYAGEEVQISMQVTDQHGELLTDGNVESAFITIKLYGTDTELVTGDDLVYDAVNKLWTYDWLTPDAAADQFYVAIATVTTVTGFVGSEAVFYRVLRSA